jgi:hypothetical protein
MERHIKKHQVFSWSHAYLDYKGLKAWLGREYPFGCWYVAPSGECGDEEDTSVTAANALHDGSRTFHGRSSSEADPLEGVPGLFGADVVSPLRSHAVIGDAARRPLEVALYVTKERHQHVLVGSPLGHSTQTTDDRRHPPPESLWPNVIEVRYPQQLLIIDQQRRDNTVSQTSGATSSPADATYPSGELLCPNRVPRSSGHRRVCIPSRTIFSANPFHIDAVLREHNDSCRTDDVPAPVMLFGCDTPSSHLKGAPLDAHVLEHIHTISKRNLAFTQKLEEECEKVERFYLNQTRAWSKVLIRLVDRAHVLLTEVNGLALAATPQLHVNTNDGAQHKQPLSPHEDCADDDDFRREYRHSVLVKQLEATEIALQRIYFAYTLLARFVVQNTEAVHHLLRKVETRSQQYLDAHTEALENKYSFMVRQGENTHPVGTLLDWIEKEYIVLIGGDKKAAARELHVAEDDAQSQDVLQKAHVWNGIVVGTMFGVTVACIVLVFLEVQLVYDVSTPITTFSGVSSSTSTVLMALTGLVAVFAALFAINIVVWDAFGVHYAFIFELDDRFHWDGLHLLKYSMRYVASWAIGLLAFVYAGRFSSSSKRTEYVPYAVLAVFGVLLVYDIWAFQTATTLFKVVPMVPRRVAHKGRVALRIFVNKMLSCCRRMSNSSAFSMETNAILQRGRHEQPKSFLSQDWSQSWLGRTMWRIITAPYFPVSFSDFYMADQLTSLTGFFGQVQVIITAAIWGTGNQYPILAALPHIWRLVQCMRRFWDQSPVPNKKVPLPSPPAAPQFSGDSDAEFALQPRPPASEPFAEDAPPHVPPVEERVKTIPFWMTIEWWHPNLTNALKYLTGIVQIVVSWRFGIMYKLETSRVDAGGPGATIDWTSGEPATLLAFWILSAALEYIFKLGWDIYMDAGLLRIGIDQKNKWASFLRPQLIYPVWTYWVFIGGGCRVAVHGVHSHHAHCGGL